MATSYGITFSVAVIARRFDMPRWQAIVLGAATTAVLGTFKELVIDGPYSWGRSARQHRRYQHRHGGDPRVPAVIR